MKLLVSIHDVMPSTLARVERILDRLREARRIRWWPVDGKNSDVGPAPVMLLVVPGVAWQHADLDRLRAWVEAGAELAGHGWCHRARDIRGLKHRLHSALISRRAAEHLALARPAIVRLMLRNHRWFGDHGLPAPKLYVPPAWAMGPVPARFLDRLPFDQYETLAGVYDRRCGTMLRLPMAGFEADTAFRAAGVATFNKLNRAWSRRSGRPLRLGIHPDDFELRLADDLAAMLRVGGQPVAYSSLAPCSPEAASDA
ncbi:MAG: polysaccharide deacetylase family protein [Wenzhouxiangellaceae bacterium]|nr:polysaccharide deacetylase family protein [Wenzhouxiangellaceae bacterium]